MHLAAAAQCGAPQPRLSGPGARPWPVQAPGAGRAASSGRVVVGKASSSSSRVDDVSTLVTQQPGAGSGATLAELREAETDAR
jgi:hypothetical protein